jgi:hypothetical protein
MSSDVPSIAVPSKKKSAAPKAVAEPAAAAAAPEPVKNLSLKVTMHCPGHPDLELTWTPVASQRGLRVQLERYDGTGCDSYKEMFVGEHDGMVSDLLMCIRTYAPQNVSLNYKDLKLSWDYLTTLALIVANDKLHRNMNLHDCGDYDCDPDAHDVSDQNYRSFVSDRIINILTGTTMVQDCRRLYYEEILKGKDCPVLLEPLRVGETIKLGCGHYLSRDGWMGCKGNTCPLCRANQASLPHPDYL